MAPAPLAFDVERSGGEPRGHVQNLGGRSEEDDRGEIDEPADQPGTGDAVDLGPRSGDPDRTAGGVERRQLAGLDPGQAGCGLGRDAALQDLGVDAGLPEPSGDGMAGRPAVLAEDHDGVVVEAAGPGADILDGASPRVGRQAGIGGKLRVSPNVDQGVGCLGPPIRRASLSTAMVFGAGMSALENEQDAMLWHVASWGDRGPHGGTRRGPPEAVNASHTRPDRAYSAAPVGSSRPQTEGARCRSLGNRIFRKPATNRDSAGQED